MNNQADIFRQINALMREQQAMQIRLSDPDIMPSEVGELLDALSEIKEDIRELENEYHQQHARLWLKEQVENGSTN